MTDLDQAPPRTRVRVPHDALLGFTAAVFAAHGVPRDRAAESAAALCHGDITGTASHGLVNLTRIYLPLLTSGRGRPDAEPRVLADRGATVLLDGRGGLGLWLAGEAMDVAVRRARDHGVGLVSVRGGTHFGCAGPHALRAVRHGMVGVVAANCGHQRIARPPRGRVPMLGTNPISVAAPAGAHPPFLLDMSTTTAPTGKVRAAARAGADVPASWLADHHGAPVTDPTRFDDGEAHLTWLGAPGDGEYKGFGLALMVEVLSALVSGAGLGPAPAALVADRTPDDDIGYFVMAVAPATLRDPVIYQRDAGSLFGALLACPPVEPGTDVSYPGVPEARHAELARREGVPLGAELYAELGEVAERLGLVLPEAC
ncbi:Ldh family oxidoreductase [Actinokineospora auranticolor]|uniref:LDH2 family malate/lactate/ureidoglycolate dehydrogenase n=1 Tax=Actinokineospora auranticolor TaxID=155976 RepID=A0A2S6GFY9_9PSEU|nr:Ldh family oxidoreductase [Actinokineospora auranticolor]PPK64066.1 LDH2 family malate/lactate/ureidoglycolate dehydrogenase [Actinokineospora auranticolor]